MASQTHSIMLSSQPSISFPVIPGALSEPETEYSYQGYETTLCQLTSDLASEVSDSEAEEYEVATDDTELEEKSSRDIESDSEIESIILEVWDAELHLDSEEEFFADESDSSTDSGSLADDERDRWSCLTCSIKNKSFMRYCFKCWEKRKDRFPEPPKRRKKRKPRPKKNKAHRQQSLVTSDQRKAVSEEEDKKASGIVVSDAASELSFQRYDSSVTTSTVVSSTHGSSSQDSGFPSVDAASETAGGSSQEFSEPSLGRKRSNDSCTFEIFPPVKLRRISGNIEDATKIGKRFSKYLHTIEGKRWLHSSQAKDLTEIINNVSSESDNDNDGSNEKCTLCYSRPKNASIIHGRLSHIGFCYPCAKRLFSSKQKCPICRRKIHMITKNSYV